MLITLERFAYLPEGTLGRIEQLGLYTLERPWLNNALRISCIPEGVYDVSPDQEGRLTGLPELQNVPGRTEICMHSANEVRELEGCIAPAMSYSITSGQPFVWQSMPALRKIMSLGDEFKIQIVTKRATL